MKVIQYTSTTQETSTEEVIVMVPTVEEREVTKMVHKNHYEVTLTQEQVDIIVAICGNVIGGGPVRRLTDSIWEGLQKHSTRADIGWPNREYSFKDFFKVDESTYNSRYLVTKD